MRRSIILVFAAALLFALVGIGCDEKTTTPPPSAIKISSATVTAGTPSIIRISVVKNTASLLSSGLFIEVEDSVGQRISGLGISYTGPSGVAGTATEIVGNARLYVGLESVLPTGDWRVVISGSVAADIRFTYDGSYNQAAGNFVAPSGGSMHSANTPITFLTDSPYPVQYYFILSSPQQLTGSGVDSDGSVSTSFSTAGTWEIVGSRINESKGYGFGFGTVEVNACRRDNEMVLNFTIQ